MLVTRIELGDLNRVASISLEVILFPVDGTIRPDEMQVVVE
jgi:hypothetical protein